MDQQSFENIPPYELAACCGRYATEWKVDASIHPNDFIFRFLLTNPCFSDKEKAVSYYFADGRKSADLLKSIFENDLALNLTQRKEMLEFASGYGCVTRHLQPLFPAFDIISSDIHPAANNFITEKLGGKSIQSTLIPESFDAERQFDLVFALSFFSHMPARTWARWLLALFKILRPGGSLIFTTHGPTSNRKVPFAGSLDEKGFYFRPESEQGDLDLTEYGITVTSCKFVVEQIEAMENCELRLVRAGLWWDHQDLYVVNKIVSTPSRTV
jgi:SAM-dependent methyltransferase